MQINFTGHEMDVTPALRDFVTDKFKRLKRHFQRISRVNVSFKVEKLRNIAEATIHLPGEILHASSEKEEDMYSAIDLLVDKLDRQLKKYKEREGGHH
jgi:putative sigma-54 modulation protein